MQRPRTRRLTQARTGRPAACLCGLSDECVARLVHACLTAPGLRFATVYGTSANTRGWWDLGPARALGYQPRDDAEVFAEEMLAAHGELGQDDPDYRYLGGRFTEMLPPGQSGADEPRPGAADPGDPAGGQRADHRRRTSAS